jgi:hypothetical protein
MIEVQRRYDSRGLEFFIELDEYGNPKESKNEKKGMDKFGIFSNRYKRTGHDFNRSRGRALAVVFSKWVRHCGSNCRGHDMVEGRRMKGRKEDCELYAELYEGLSKVTSAVFEYLSDAKLPPKDISLDAIQDFMIRIKAEQLRYNGYSRGDAFEELDNRIDLYNITGERRHLIDAMFYIYREIIEMEHKPRRNINGEE